MFLRARHVDNFFYDNHLVGGREYIPTWKFGGRPLPYFPIPPPLESNIQSCFCLVFVVFSSNIFYSPRYFSILTIDSHDENSYRNYWYWSIIYKCWTIPSPIFINRRWSNPMYINASFIQPYLVLTTKVVKYISSLIIIIIIVIHNLI